MAGLSADTLRGAASWLPERRMSMPVQLAASATAHVAPELATIGDTAFDAGRHMVPRRCDAFDSLSAGGACRSGADGLARRCWPRRRIWNQQPVAAAMFKELAEANGAGLCASCHSVEQTAAGALTINWRAYDRTTEPRTFTKFSHGPHLLLPQLADCTQLPRDRTTRRTRRHRTSGWNPHQFVSEFQADVEAAVRGVPHGDGGGRRCQSCHNYHVEGGGVAVQRGWRDGSAGSAIADLDSAERSPRESDTSLVARTSSGIRPGRR